MMDLSGVRAGFALTGSFCTFSAVIPEIKKLTELGTEVFPIMSEHAASIDSRFGQSADFKREIEEITGKKVWHSIADTEPIGPKKLLDILIVAPCTGNTLGKLAQGITDGAVTMAVKAHLRNSRPVLIAVSTNDGLAGSGKNIGALLNCKNVFFVPFGQDNAFQKPTSLVAHMDKIIPAAGAALMNQQIQPLLQ